MTTEQSLNQEVHDIWNQNAPFWDEYMGEGNDFQKLLVGPASERLLNLQKDELVLEIACGNGAFARRMAQLGARVIATDFSEQFIERAQVRSAQYAGRLEYRVVDATNREQLLALGQYRFDAIVCNMGIMDMTAIDPLMSAVSKLLKPNVGRFVFSLMHPCFNSNSTLMLEEEDRDGQIVETYAIKVSTYLHMTSQKGLGIIGQPVPHYYFHRPLHVLLATCFNAGLVMDGLEEPAFDTPSTSKRVLSWVRFKEIPPVLAVRLRVR
ncbi:MAG: class I SAM-dependent methyltransferase [Ktedonobacteraceae bacterium]